MNWMRFLAASQSFIGMKCKNSPYRVTQRSWLRMVGAICQPMQVAAGVAVPTGAPGPGGARSMEGRSESSPLFTTPAAAAKPTRSLSPGEVAQTGRGLSGPQPELSLPATKASGARSVSGMKSARSRLFKMQRPLKQAELTLDTVQVVRNDLMETDLELIPMELPKPSPARAGVEASGLATQSLGGLMMSRFAAGLVGARKTGG